MAVDDSEYNDDLDIDDEDDLEEENDFSDEDDEEDLDLDEETDLEDDEDDEVSETVNENEHSSSLLKPEDVELNVKCEVGAVSYRLDQLLSLKVGDSINFHKRQTDLVKLSVNGSYFAEGYLVDVNGMLGVKITHRINRV